MEQANVVSGLNVAGPVEIYEYAAGAEAPGAPDWSVFSAGADVISAGKQSHRQGTAESAVPVDRTISENRMVEERRNGFEEGRQQGVLEGRQVEREAQAAALANAEQRYIRQSAQLIESFAFERDRYFQAVEPEVVKLALAVAARILRREAQMDPLLLTGAVRVALGQLAGSTEVRLKVPAADLEMWSEAIKLLPNLALKPSVVAGEGMRLGDCAIEASMGTVDLGIRSQLAEIESGFFDRAGGNRSEPVALVDDSVGVRMENRR